MAPRFVIQCTHGVEAPERTNQALTVAATALAAGAEVSVWLAGEAAWLAVPGRADELVLRHATPAADLLSTILAGGALTVCSQCAARRELTVEDLLPGARIAGSASFVEEGMQPGVQVLVY